MSKSIFFNVVARIKSLGLALFPVIIFISSLIPLISNAEQMPTSYQQCIACHGEKAQGNSQLHSPALAGQSASYLARQLNNFKQGLRGEHQQDTYGKQMVALSQQLDNNKEVPELSTYLASLPQSDISQETSGDLKNGSRYYQAKCGACHGGQAEGNESFNAPKLSGQHIDYLQRQMKNFVNGIRGTAANDRFGRQMAMMATTTSGKELDDILHYIASQK